jgi:hypothetical protein
MCAWTYAGTPQASPVDEVHYRLGDTNPANPISTDEECAFALAEHRGNTWLAAAALAETKAMEFLYRPTTVKKGDRMTSYADQAQAFLTLARQLRNNASLRTTTLYAGGQDVGEKDANRRDTSVVQPFARADLHNPRPHLATDSEAREP